MELQLDLRPPIKQTSSSESSLLWMLSLADPNRSPDPLPAPRPYSYLSECECPDDCLRDHENE